MLLDTTTRSMVCVLDAAPAANQPAFVASWTDMTDSSTTGATATGVTTGTAAVTVIPAPSVGVIRKVTGVSIYNTDTAAATVTVSVVDGANTLNVVRATLQVGWSLQFVASDGWQMLAPDGAVVHGGGGGGGGAVGNLDGGSASTVYGGTSGIDGGSA